MSGWDGPLIRFGDMRIQTDSQVYGPDDDSFLLEKHGTAVLGERVLEVGCGTGFVAVSRSREGAHVTATDINPAAVELTAHNASLNECDMDVRVADLFEGVDGTFDVVLFNPPYLPTGEGDHVPGPVDSALDGGPAGDDLILLFLRELSRFLTPHGRAYMVVSGLTSRTIIDGVMGSLFRWEVAGSADAGMERLDLLKLTMVRT